MGVFLARLRRVLPNNVPIHVNSGYRDARSQAQAMLTKVRLGDDLVKLYGEKVRMLLSLPLDVDTWTRTIQAMADRGIYISRHMRGDALDLRTRHMAPMQVQLLWRAVIQAGGRPLLESQPPHLHVDHLQGGGPTVEALAPLARAHRGAKASPSASPAPALVVAAVVVARLFGVPLPFPLP